MPRGRRYDNAFEAVGFDNVEAEHSSYPRRSDARGVDVTVKVRRGKHAA